MRIALFYSSDKTDDGYFDIKETEKKYGVTLEITEDHDWGGECIFEIDGTPDQLRYFALNFCLCENINELKPTNE